MYEVEVAWNGGSLANCSDAAGNSIEIDWEENLSPVQVMVQMAGLCSMIDIIVGMKHRRMENLKVRLSYERSETDPRFVTSVRMLFTMRTEPRHEKLLARLIDRSMSTYCSVSNTLNGVAKFDWDLIIES